MQSRMKDPAFVLADAMTGSTGSVFLGKRLSAHVDEQQLSGRTVLIGETDPFNRVDAVVRAPAGTSWN